MNTTKNRRKIIIAICTAVVALLLIFSAYGVYPNALAGTSSERYLPRITCFYCP